MKAGLLELKKTLQADRVKLTDKLKTIDDNIASIDKVLSLVDVQKSKPDDKQLTLLPQIINQKTNQPTSERFKNITFYKAVNLLFNENPGKAWKPAEITTALLEEGFTTNSKNFNNTVRTLLLNMRKGERINATRTKEGWLYGDIKKGSVSLTGETEPLNKIGGLPE